MLIDLGLEKEVVGRTKFCIHPADVVANIPKIGGTKNVRIDDVVRLQPDLVIANKEENTKEDVELLQQHTRFSVFLLTLRGSWLNLSLRPTVRVLPFLSMLKVPTTTSALWFRRPILELFRFLSTRMSMQLSNQLVFLHTRCP